MMNLPGVSKAALLWEACAPLVAAAEPQRHSPCDLESPVQDQSGCLCRAHSCTARAQWPQKMLLGISCVAQGVKARKATRP